MNRFLLLLALPLLLATCHGEAPRPDAALIGHWLSTYRLESTGNWQPLYRTAESRALLTEYRPDGTIAYSDSNGLFCCLPTRYSVSRTSPCPPNSTCPQVTAAINFSESVACPNVSCVTPAAWTGYTVNDTYLDVYTVRPGQPIYGVRYERVKFR